MLIVRSPLRISLFGGGTDIEPFTSRHGGEVISFALARYIYLSIHPLVESDDILLKYSMLERSASPNELKHPVIRELAKIYSLKSVDISISSDIAAGTGLGSSSSFTVGAIHLIRKYLGLSTESMEVALEACRIEIDTLREPIGTQDQFASALGGLNVLKFGPQRSVEVNPIYITKDIKDLIHNNLILVRVGTLRRSSSILEEQKKRLADSAVEETLLKMKELSKDGVSALRGDIQTLGQLLTKSWLLKRTLSPGVSNKEIDDLFDYVIRLGAFGGKLLGAGGSGYLLFAVSAKVRQVLIQNPKLVTLNVEVDMNGCKVIYEN